MTAKEKSTHPHIESIPYFGTTWYRRSVSYWLRRALASVIFFFVLVIFTLMTEGLVQVIATDRSVPLLVRGIILVIIVAAIVRSVIKAWSAFNAVNRARKHGAAMSLAEASGEPPRSPRERRRSAGGGTGTGAFATAGSVAAGALLVISVVFNFGWGVVLLIVSFQKYLTPEEFAAWQKIERKRRQHAD